MGWKRVICSGCLGMLCLIPMAWLSFMIGLTSAVTGGLITNLQTAFTSLGTLGTILQVVGGAFLGIIMIILFPIHWALIYRPNDVFLIFALILPWVLCCSITAAIFAHSPRGGLHTSLAIGIGYMVPSLLMYAIIPLLINNFAPGFGGVGIAVLDGLSTGLTDLPYLLNVFLSILEGCLVGAVFGSFIGSLKYKPDAEAKKTKSSKKEKTVAITEKAISTSNSTSSDFCVNCGALFLLFLKQ
ncbi:MAG: hypothetical protein P8Y70_07835 [Candidatus Lokiarchaeota archaeon]